MFFDYPKSAGNVVVDDIYFTGEFIFGVADRFSLFPMNCRQYQIQDDKEYKKYRFSTEGAKILRKYPDQIFYEFSYVMSCVPQPAFDKLDFSQLLIEEVKRTSGEVKNRRGRVKKWTEGVVVIHYRNVTASHGSFLLVGLNMVNEFEDYLQRVVFPEKSYDKFEVLDLQVYERRKKYPNGTTKTMGRLLTGSVIIFYRSEKFSEKMRVLESEKGAKNGSGKPKEGRSQDFTPRVVVLKAKKKRFQKEGEFPFMGKIRVESGAEFADEVRFIKSIVYVEGAWNEFSSRNYLEYEFLAIFGCKENDFMAVSLYLQAMNLDDLVLIVSEPFSTMISLSEGIDLKLPVNACLSRTRKMLFYQNHPDRQPSLSSKTLNPNYLRNTFDFDLGHFNFSRVLTMVCVPEFQVGVVIGEVEIKETTEIHAGPKKGFRKKGMGFLIVKLSHMQDYHNRLFDYFTMSFVAKNFEQDVRVYPIGTESTREALIIMVKHMRAFHTRKVLLDGPDLYVTPRNESIYMAKNYKKVMKHEATFLVRYYFNNSKDWVPWGLDMELKTGFDQLAVESIGYKKVLNRTVFEQIMTKNEIEKIRKGLRSGEKLGDVTGLWNFNWHYYSSGQNREANISGYRLNDKVPFFMLDWDV